MIMYVLIFIAGLVVGYRVRGSRSPASTPPAPASRDVTDEEIEDLLRHGHKLEAIRRYREIHRCDIATAHTRVELLEALLRQ